MALSVLNGDSMLSLTVKELLHCSSESSVISQVSYGFNV